jgi:uncharacterized membrane protein YkvA (DUF1232 family)
VKASIKRWVRRMKRRLQVIGEILRHPETPWYARVVGFLVIAYAASPLDLIPDFIPVLGYLDDVILIPLGIVLVVRLTPRAIRQEAMRSVVRGANQDRSGLRPLGTALIVAMWIALAYLVTRLLFRVIYP